jgi:acyl-CoA synthetase (AMP-forming)/AMP-acid ligase II/acyl carrier protein
MAEGRKPLTYLELIERIDLVVEELHTFGIGRNDRIAIVLPNGPEMAVAFLAVASGATAAPLNPAYQKSEYEFYLSDINANALLVEAGSTSPSIDVAEQLGIPILELAPGLDYPAGHFSISSNRTLDEKQDGFSQPQDVGLVLHTSGTTSRPKIVPLTQENLVHSAFSIQSWLELTPADRVLNVMPLFHVHGILASLLASLTAGASVVCTSGFLAPRFFEWMDEYHPTWYTAVPTMHQSILSRTEQHGDILRRRQFRFIRSCSAALPPQVMMALEKIFGVPVVEAYGMTEASHQIACNPLPPRVRKPGSVGLATGTEVAIMDEVGDFLPIGEQGEIVVKGKAVASGYENNPDANQASFSDGWFRTGDLGHLDREGYIFISGRKKEIINRGGEKISPREVDEVLLDHPAIEQAVVFGFPDPELGEDVAAAVVLREGSDLNQQELRRYVALRLATFKIPSYVVFLDEIPKGPTGKLQRIGLADRLNITSLSTSKGARAEERIEPSSPMEKRLLQIWSEVLGLSEFGVGDRFLDLGGDSMLAGQIVSRVREAFQIEVSIVDFFEAPTIAEMAKVLEGRIIEEIESFSDEEVKRQSDAS